MIRIARWELLVSTLLLSACGSGDPPTIHIASHLDGQVVADRNITLSGTGERMSSVEVKLNGMALPSSAVLSTATTFTANLTLANNSNTIEAIAKNGDGSASSGVITVVYPFVTLTTFQNASVVIGQTDFKGFAWNGGTPGAPAPAPSANTLYSPMGPAFVTDGKLYLPDTYNNRVLVFNSVPTANGAAADLVLGQPNFTTYGYGTTAATLGGPLAVVAGSGKLLIDDFSNSRVVVFNSIPTSSGAAADVAIGQDDLTTADWVCAANRFSGPTGIYVANGRILVADTGGNRVLIWNTIPSASGASPDLVLGQANLTNCAYNGGSAASASTLNNPSGVWSDGTHLVIADSGNNRVLVWNTFPTANGTPADLVLGQAGFTGTAPSTTPGGLNSPSSVSSNGKQLFVSDQYNNRVLIWNSFPTANGAPADVVLGQGDFTHAAANDDGQVGTSGTAPTARTLNWPTGVAVWGNQLFVTDTKNSRVLIYNGQ